MVDLLAKNQADDDKQKDWCNEEFHTSAGEEVATKRALDKASASIDEHSDGIMTLQGEIETLNAEIKELDKTVAQATEQRKEEHAEYTQHMQMSSAAKQLVEKAKNRLNKFYSPTQYKAPPTTTESSSPYGLLQVDAAAHHRLRAHQEPPAAPETFSGDYKKSSGSGGVIGLMKMIVHELDMDIQDAEHDEKSAQKDYTELMQESQEARAQDSKSITSKEAAKAQPSTKLANMNEQKRSTSEELLLVQRYIGQLHQQCDFVLQNYEERKAARAEETDALTSAKAMLSGAR